jgi:hypothetical protein
MITTTKDFGSGLPPGAMRHGMAMGGEMACLLPPGFRCPWGQWFVTFRRRVRHSPTIGCRDGHFIRHGWSGDPLLEFEP